VHLLSASILIVPGDEFRMPTSSVGWLATPVTRIFPGGVSRPATTAYLT
jgi:hypothetical protein